MENPWETPRKRISKENDLQKSGMSIMAMLILLEGKASKAFWKLPSSAMTVHLP
jgi:hypothetical protein